MKKTVWKAVTFLLVFLISLFVLGYVTNRSNTDMTVEMAPASLPVVYVDRDGLRLNEMHGYLEAMEPGTMREHITPIGEDRELAVSIDLYGQRVTELAFEVRSADGSRLVEQTKITDYATDGESIAASFQIKDLITQGREYNLVVLLTLEDGRTVRYYTRIVQAEAYHTGEKLAFAAYFHEKTFADKESAKEITKYLESNVQGDNTTFSKVDIHSSFSQITWGELRPEKVTEPVYLLREDGIQTGSIASRYYVRYRLEGQWAYAVVEEFYRLRYTSERIYLLQFERTMEQLFDKEADFGQGKILLGITDPKKEIVESDGGSSFAFVNGGRLYGYSVTDTKLSQIFAFYKKENTDARTLYGNHTIKILNVDETGNVSFLVCGYMNRGRHEGMVGIQVNLYNAQTNTVEESAFIPYRKSSQVLQSDLRVLSYINNGGLLYLMLEGTIYEVDLESRSSRIIVENLEDGSFQASESNRMLVWQKENRQNSSNTLILMNLSNGKIREIRAKESDYIRPLGFIGEDLIYGLAVREDVARDTIGGMLFPMYELRIENEEGRVLKTYGQDSLYVVDSSIEDNRISLTRVRKEEDGKYVPAEADQIMNNESPKEGVNRVEVAAVDVYGKIVQIAVKNSIDTKKLQMLTPKEVLFEGGREMALPESKEQKNRYYVYGKNRLLQSFTDPGEAVKLAAGVSGSAAGDDGVYIYKKGNLVTRNQIMAIKADAATAERCSLAVCLDTVLGYEGVVKNSQFLLEQGENAMDILQEYLPDVRVLDLTGCDIDSMLFYVNQDIPVLATLENGEAVLVIGFNELNIVLMDPSDGRIYKKGIKDSREWFEENGNRFLTYVRREE